MNTYELTYIVNPVRNDDQTRGIVNKITSFVKDNGGNVLDLDEWGNQRLAYQIDRKRNGFYVNMYFEAPGEIIPRLERMMEINDDILRYLTLRMDAKMLRHYERRKQKRAAAKAAENE